MRRAHDHLSAPAVRTCPNCQEPVLAHRVCTNCGFYKGEKYNLPGLKDKE
jgi:large subunit ribosomal protein L32